MLNKKEESQPKERKEAIKIHHTSNTIHVMQKDICNLKNHVLTLTQTIKILEGKVIVLNMRKRSLWNKFKALF